MSDEYRKLKISSAESPRSEYGQSEYRSEYRLTDNTAWMTTLYARVCHYLNPTFKRNGDSSETTNTNRREISVYNHMPITRPPVSEALSYRFLFVLHACNLRKNT